MAVNQIISKSLVDLDSDPLVSIAPLPERQMLQDEDHVPWFHIVR
jgi:hypothetical protein